MNKLKEWIVENIIKINLSFWTVFWVFQSVRLCGSEDVGHHKVDFDEEIYRTKFPTNGD